MIANISNRINKFLKLKKEKKKGEKSINETKRNEKTPLILNLEEERGEAKISGRRTVTSRLIRKLNRLLVVSPLPPPLSPQLFLLSVLFFHRFHRFSSLVLFFFFILFPFILFRCRTVRPACRLRDERPNRWPERARPLLSARPACEEAATGTHVKTIGTQVYRIYRRKRRRTVERIVVLRHRGPSLGSILFNRPIDESRRLLQSKLFVSWDGEEFVLMMDRLVAGTRGNESW